MLILLINDKCRQIIDLVHSVPYDAAIYRQQKVLSHFPVCCWIDWLLMIKNCLIESVPPGTILWDRKLCSPLKVDQCFGGT
jgi:hypothetical protein